MISRLWNDAFRLIRDLAIGLALLLVTAWIWPYVWDFNRLLTPNIPWAPVIAVAATASVVYFARERFLLSSIASATDAVVSVLLCGLIAAVLPIAALVYLGVMGGGALSIGYLATLPVVVTITFVLSDSLLRGILEEIVFRGLLQQALLQKFGALVAIGITTLLFMIAHVPNASDLRMLPYWGFFSVVLGYVSWRQGSVRSAAVIHVLHNIIAVVLAGASGLGDSIIAISERNTTLGIALLVAGLLMIVMLLRRLLFAKSANNAQR